MSVYLLGPAKPLNPQRKWLKAAAAADVAHLVIYVKNDDLLTACNQHLDYARVVFPRYGARVCELCQAFERQSRHERKMGKKRRG